MPGELTAWEIYRLCIQDGDTVIAFDDDDRLHFGIVGSDEEGCWITAPFTLERHRLQWADVTFIGQAGFPIRKLRGADGSLSSMQVEHDDTVKLVRAALGRTYTRRQVDSLSYFDADQVLKRAGITPVVRTLVGGDPLMIEDVRAHLFHPGNDHPYYWSDDGEEILVMEARDGARGLMWNMQSVFHLELENG